jgi:hypothetical protein
MMMRQVTESVDCSNNIAACVKQNRVSELRWLEVSRLCHVSGGYTASSRVGFGKLFPRA